MWLFAAWNGLSVVLAGHAAFGEVTRGLGRWGLVALAFSLLLRIAARPNMKQVVVGAILAVGLTEALFGLWAYLVDWMVQSTEVARLIGLELWRSYQPLFATTPGRISGSLGISSNFFGALMLIPTLLAAAVFLRGRGRFTTVVWGLVTGALFFALTLSYTRASVLAVLVGFIVMIVLTRRWRLVGLVAGLLVLGVILTPIASRFVDESNDRLALTHQALDTARKHPVTGLGSGDYVAGQFDANAPVLIATPHNSFLLAATETGIPGGVLLLVAAMVPGVIAVLGVVRRRGGVLLIGSVAAMIAFGSQTLSNSLFHIPSVAAFYWLIAAAAVAMARDLNAEPPGV
jgi:O-antigen ligase